MQVSDFQVCLRALAALKMPAKTLTEAADALEPFSKYKMEEFAEFLQRVEAKYGETKELPDAKPPKPPPRPRAGKAPAPTVEELLSAVETLKQRLRSDQTLTKEGVAAELKRFDKMGAKDLYSCAQRLGLQSKPKNKGHAMDMIVNHTVSAQGGVERSDA